MSKPVQENRQQESERVVRNLHPAVYVALVGLTLWLGLAIWGFGYDGQTDYLLAIGNNFVLVLDAKAPGEDVRDGSNVEQVYSYAIHPEIRVNLFGLCNGREFCLFDVYEKVPLLCFKISEIKKYVAFKITNQ